MEKLGFGKIGGKAENLEIISKHDFNVPRSIALCESIFDKYLSKSKGQILQLLKQLNQDNIAKTSSEILKVLDGLQVDIVAEELADCLEVGNKYAVRSSGTQEDLKEHSFAGVYTSYLNVQGLDDVVDKVVKCYRSLYSERALAYHLQTNLPDEDYKMAVLIQEMIEPEYSGVLFTSNTLATNDQEMYIEFISGYGENLVSGLVNPEPITVPWFGEVSSQVIDAHLLTKLRDEGLRLQKFYGFPVDIEFCINDDVHIMQVRPITSFDYSKFETLWTNANFRDGLAKTPATPIMNSLYKYIWEAKYPKYLIETKLIKEEELTASYKIFMANAYWNLSLAKKAMSKIIGYKERRFDEELGIVGNYSGDGKVVGLNPKSLLQIIRTAPSVKRIEREFERKKQETFDKYLKKYHQYVEKKPNCDTIEKDFYQLTKFDYFQVEGSYYWQIFINTVRLSLFQSYSSKYVDAHQYLNIISNIDNISHLRVFSELQDLSQSISKNEEALNFWKKANVDEINKLDENLYHLKEFKSIVNKYGYHSEKELRIDYPNYIEDNSPLISFVKECIEIEANVVQNPHSLLMKDLEAGLSKKAFKKFALKTEAIRDALWWREEYKDLSTRYYHLIRVYGQELARKFVSEKVIESVEDIWYAKITDIWQYIDKEISDSELREMIFKNKLYYAAYRNKMMPNELGTDYHEAAREKGEYSGTGSSNGIVTGEVCVINSTDKLVKIDKEVIVVANNLEPSFISKIGFIKAIITESGGLLCHYSVVAREVNIPCVVNVNNIVNELKDGMIVSVNGATGTIQVLEGKDE